MRWDALFADLEAQAADADRRALDDEVAERSRLEMGRVALLDRVRGAAGDPVVLRVAGGEMVRGRVTAVGSDWVLVCDERGDDALVFAVALTGVEVGGTAVVPPDQVGARLGSGYALRAVARDRAGVSIRLTDGTGVTGTIDRVGADFAEVAVHPPGEPPRAGAPRATRLVPTAAIAVVRPTP